MSDIKTVGMESKSCGCGAYILEDGTKDIWFCQLHTLE